MSTTTPSKIPRSKFWLRVAAVVIALYIAGYFILMDRLLPTSPHHHDAHHFESSYRWAAKQNSQKGGLPDMPWPNATGWNDLYRPLDRIYFRFFPRSEVEIKRLKE